MKWLITTLVCIAFFSGESLGQSKGTPIEPEDKVSYSVGYQIGADFQVHKIVLKPEALAKGASDAMGGRKPLLSPEEMRAVLIELQKRMGERNRLLMEESSRKKLAFEEKK